MNNGKSYAGAMWSRYMLEKGHTVFLASNEYPQVSGTLSNLNISFEEVSNNFFKLSLIKGGESK